MLEAVYTTVSACARQHEGIVSQESLSSLLPDRAAFLQRELADIDLALLIKNFFTSTVRHSGNYICRT